MTAVDVSTLPVLPPSSYIPPLFNTSLGEDAIALAALCGLYLDDWQQEIVKGLCSFDERGRLAARRALLLIPRQQGKNICIEARELAGLFLLQEKVMLHTAHEFATAQSSFERLKEHIHNGGEALPNYHLVKFRNHSADTAIRIPRVKRTVGKAKKREPSYIQFGPRTPGRGRGLTVEFLVVDEAYHYTDTQASALSFTQNQSTDPQILITSSTGFPESLELMAERELGLSRELSNMMFVEFKSDDGSDPGDESQWYKALPGLRTGRQDIAEIRAHYAKARTQFEKGIGDYNDFDREVRGLWASTDVPSLIPMSLWDSLQVPDGEPWLLPSEFAFGVSVSPPGESGQFASVYACGMDELGFFHVWQVGADEGIGWIPEFLKIQQEQRSPRVTVIDSQSPAGALLPEFDRLGVQYTNLTSGNCMAACSQFEAKVRDGRLRHGADDVLRQAVGSGVRRYSGFKGAWFWDAKNHGDNISSLVAATYAMFGLSGVEPAKKRSGGWW